MDNITYCNSVLLSVTRIQPKQRFGFCLCFQKNNENSIRYLVVIMDLIEKSNQNFDYYNILSGAYATSYNTLYNISRYQGS